MCKNTPIGCNGSAAFTLIQLAVTLTVLSLLFAWLIANPHNANASKREEITTMRLKDIERAISGYSAATRTYPCPANAVLATTHAQYGKAMTPPGGCSGGTFGASSNVVAGMIPIKELGLSSEHAFDGFGRRFTYMVDMRTTLLVDTIPPSSLVTIACTSGSRNVRINSPIRHNFQVGDTISIVGWPALAVLTCPSGNVLGTRTVTQVISATEFVFQQASPAIVGLSVTISGVTLNRGTAQDCSDIASNLAIQVKQSNGSFKKAAIIIISHGANGHGAFPAIGSAIANRINAGAIAADEQENASVNGSFQLAFNNIAVAKETSAAFDDVVKYSTSCKP